MSYDKQVQKLMAQEEDKSAPHLAREGSCDVMLSSQPHSAANLLNESQSMNRSSLSARREDSKAEIIMKGTGDKKGVYARVSSALPPKSNSN